MSKQTSKGLGKGFGSLLPQNFDQSMLLDKHDRVQKVALTDITADPNQPRRTFDEQLINELAQSIEQYGILQPLVVTEKDDKYYIVAGERRFRAAQVAGLDRVPVLVRSLKEIERLEISLIENVQRVDLNPIEQAVSIAKLHEQFNLSYQEISKRLGKAIPTVSNIVRLLQLPDFAREALVKGIINEGHARAVLSLKHVDQQKELVQNIEQFGWSVRMAEQFASERKDKKPAGSRPSRAKAPVLNEKLSTKLTTKWGFSVKVTEKPRGGGKVLIDLDSRKEFDAFLKFLERESL